MLPTPTSASATTGTIRRRPKRSFTRSSTASSATGWRQNDAAVVIGPSGDKYQLTDPAADRLRRAPAAVQGALLHRHVPPLGAGSRRGRGPLGL